tara:strand:+ start:60416 stop:60886 length:471 start_codon:yes stop_codon:yes gene_type:complete
MGNLVTTRKNGSKVSTNSNGLSYPTWSSWLDEAFNWELPSVFITNYNSLPEVNIRETKDAYFVDMAVPGLKKSDFRINLDNQVLSICTEVEENNEQKEDNFIRREFGYSSFKRSFSLPKTINEDDINAKYTDGVLSIHLPKNEEAIQNPARTIKIS